MRTGSAVAVMKPCEEIERARSIAGKRASGDRTLEEAEALPASIGTELAGAARSASDAPRVANPEIVLTWQQPVAKEIDRAPCAGKLGNLKNAVWGRSRWLLLFVFVLAGSALASKGFNYGDALNQEVKSASRMDRPQHVIGEHHEQDPRPASVAALASAPVEADSELSSRVVGSSFERQQWTPNGSTTSRLTAPEADKVGGLASRASKRKRGVAVARRILSGPAKTGIHSAKDRQWTSVFFQH